MASSNNGDTHFSHLFWFCVMVFISSFAAMMLLLFGHIPEQNREMASNAQGFLQGSLIMTAVGYLLTGSPANKKTVGDTPLGTTTADISATITTNTESSDVTTVDNVVVKKDDA